MPVVQRAESVEAVLQVGHHGRAATIRDALTKYDTDGRHGNLSKLSPSEIDDLIAYVLSL